MILLANAAMPANIAIPIMFLTCVRQKCTYGNMAGSECVKVATLLKKIYASVLE